MHNSLVELNLDDENIIKAVEDDITIIEDRIRKEESAAPMAK